MEIAVNEFGQQIVVLPDVIFTNKQNINWNEVEKYLERYVGMLVEIAETRDIVYIGRDFPDEFTGSRYTRMLKGARAKAKANAVQGVREMVEIATDRHFKDNCKEKHSSDAANGKKYLYDIVDIKKEASNPLKTNNSQMV